MAVIPLFLTTVVMRAQTYVPLMARPRTLEPALKIERLEQKLSKAAASKNGAGSE